MEAVIVILAIIINLVAWPILGILELRSGNSVGWKYILIPLGIIVLFCIWSKKQDKNLDKINRWKKIAFSKNKINVNEIKFQIKSMNDSLVYLLYTNDKRLFFVNENKEYINQILLDKILKVETQANIEENQKQKVIALTTTFYTTQKVLSYIIKIITEDNTITILTAPTFENKESIERFKLLLERDINNNIETVKKINLNKNL